MKKCIITMFGEELLIQSCRCVVILPDDADVETLIEGGQYNDTLHKQANELGVGWEIIDSEGVCLTSCAVSDESPTEEACGDLPVIEITAEMVSTPELK
jgi:hypothetical protein